METDIQKQSFIKGHKKLMLSVLIGVMLVGFAVAGAVYYHSIDVDATISEALSSTTISLDFSGFPGETITKTIDVSNLANVDLQTQLVWTETSNVNAVSYTTDMPKIVTVNSGANTINVEFVYAPDTTTGLVEGTITLNRYA